MNVLTQHDLGRRTRDRRDDRRSATGDVDRVRPLRDISPHGAAWWVDTPGSWAGRSNGELSGRCSVTGRAEPLHGLASCAAQGRHVLAACIRQCRHCGQQVSPRILQRSIRVACRTLEPVSRDDPRVVHILGEYPQWEHWPWWCLAETAAAYVARVTGWTRTRMVVLDRETLAVRRIAAASRWFGRWRVLATDRWPTAMKR